MHELTGNWNYPSRMIVGAGAICRLPDLCRELGIQAPLLITDPGLSALPMVNNTVTACREAQLECGLFDNIQSNPTGQNVTDGVTAFRAGKHDGVIGFGGGSALDAAKAIAMMSGQRRELWDFEDLGDNWTRVNESGMAPVIAVPTTAGTGSEVGRASVITHVELQIKKIIFHPAMMPVRVILDPKLTVDLPAKITAATGIDALSHCLEALCAPGYHPMAEGIAIEGIRLVHDFLPRAVFEGHDIEARTQMLVASSMGATAFQKGLGAMHALAHPLGALYNAHHGLLNAILMPYVLVANQQSVHGKLLSVSRYLGLPNPGFDSFLQWVLELRASLGIPNCLADIGISDAEAERIGRMAEADPSASGNPIAFKAETYSLLFRDAVSGSLERHS